MIPPTLPIHAYEEQIVSAVKENEVVVVIAETGSGKTTQISQMLDRAGFTREGMIGVTQPRRVAAVSVARRVAEEMGCEVGQQVGYSVRFEERACSRTRIKYLTDGTLLREAMSGDGGGLARYSVVVLDEAHERSLNTDILFGVLKKLLQQRRDRGPPLRLVITSATLEGDKLAAYFSGCPVLHVPGRCFKVDIVHSQEEHKSDYMAAAVDTALDIHCRQGSGDILVFMTGQAEIDKACRLLMEAILGLPEGAAGDLMVLPLYAALPPEMQVRIFAPPPPGVRRCIVATNVAETSVTVPGVVYVIDTGMVKQKCYNPVTGMDTLDVTPISRVQATQRAGRAGRTAPGQCFRLYTRRHFEREMPEVTVPEIQRMSLVGAVLYLKSLDMDIDVLCFDYLDPPAPEQLEDALRQLYILGAIDRDGGITPLGRRMVALPLDAGLSRALLAAQELGCEEDALTVAAMLSVETLFVGNRGPQQLLAAGDDDAARGQGRRGGAKGHPPVKLGERGRELLKQLQREGLGDHVLYLRLYQACEASDFSPDFCRAIGVEARGIKFARDIRRQVARALEAEADRGGARPPPHNEHKAKRRRTEGAGGGDTSALRRALLIGFAHRLAYRLPRVNGYKPLSTRTSSIAHIHPSAALVAADDDGMLPKWLLYHELIATGNVFLSKVCVVDDEWVQLLLPRITDVDVQRLSGGASTVAAQAAAEAAAVAAQQGGQPAAPAQPAGERRNRDDAINAARARFLARKASGKTGGKG